MTIGNRACQVEKVRQRKVISHGLSAVVLVVVAIAQQRPQPATVRSMPPAEIKTVPSVGVKTVPPVDVKSMRRLSVNVEKEPSAFWSPEGMLVLVGFLTCGILIWQGVLMRKAANAAKDSAEASVNQTNIFKDKERARLRLEIGGIEIDPTPGPSPVYLLKYRIRFDGATPAFQVSVNGKTGVEAKTERTLTMGIADTLSPNLTVSPVIKQDGEPWLYSKLWNLTQGEIAAIQAGERQLHFRGAINFTDIFDQVWSVPFYWAWRFQRFGSAPEQVFSEWIELTHFPDSETEKSGDSGQESS